MSKDGGMKPQEHGYPGQPEGWLGRSLPVLMARILPPLFLFWARTLRVKITGAENLRRTHREGGALYGIWHGNMPIPVFTLRNRNVVALVSPVWLGEIIARIVGQLGFNFIRASSNYNTHQGVREILKTLRADREVAIMLDGPSGPARTVQAGVVNLASMSGKPIILGFAAADKTFRLPTWDGSEWPYPFSRAVLRIGEPIHVPKRLTREGREEYRRMIEERLFQLEEEARDELASLPPCPSCAQRQR